MKATLTHGIQRKELAEYLQCLRVEVAKQSLESKPVNFDEVSLRVGYTDAGTFRQLFKRKTGLTPRDYQIRFARPSSPDNDGDNT